MRQSSQMLRLLAAGLLLFGGSAVADKPTISECPCWGTDLGLQESVETVRAETCVESLETWTFFFAPELRAYYFWPKTVPGTFCFEFQIRKGRDPYVNICQIRVGTADIDSDCQYDQSYRVEGISDAEFRLCRRALNEAEDYLSVLAMCE